MHCLKLIYPTSVIPRAVSDGREVVSKENKVHVDRDKIVKVLLTKGDEDLRLMERSLKVEMVKKI